MAAARSVAEQAADFLIACRNSPLPPDVASIARTALTDYVGVALAGAAEPVARNVRAWACERASGAGATVIGTAGLRLDPENAALCNAVAGHALDFDDTSWVTIGHPTSVVAPAALAVAEQVGASGADALRAYVAGVEVAHRIAELCMPEASEAGWHTTGALYVLGAAAAAAVLLNIDRTACVHALGLAASRSGGVRSNFGTQAKPWHAGMAARNGLEAVSLARAGVTASRTAIEGQDGYIACLAGVAARARFAGRELTFGAPFDLAARGLAFKRFPCCSGSHPACDLTLDLMAEHGFGAGDVTDIHVGVSLLAERELVVHAPKTPQEARFSMEFALAATLVHGPLTWDLFAQQTLADPMVQQLMGVVRIELSPELAALGFIGTAPVRMTFHLRDGRVIHGAHDLAIGNPERPMSPEDHAAKFRSCATRAMAPAAADAMLGRLRAIDQERDLAALWATAASI
ncbi:MmgE/PrpD family protein [Ancylobacter rudongensis]|uniref:2-methylcitrate dehydratase PrpD n=1 Tax=Ancylobacter rudongensis TaxID=177413 RepID=A0A1G4RR25_9HYPH|nr:MmgE/PrpD family protein [Ancylobacter rudongensis]SCW59177.1 2-methylcitrate dehydratase PrpD [Ancylobacter rudongensis]